MPTSDHNIKHLHLTESLQKAFEAISLQQQDEHNIPLSQINQRRRISLPADPNAFISLKRTVSHKRFPHLNPTKSIPFGFSPELNREKPDGLHLSRSHCTLPHLPPGHPFNRTRRVSLPPDFKSTIQRNARFNNRRTSFPLTEDAMRQRQLHRCKAIHKANITLRDLLVDWKKTATPSPLYSTNMKRVKSDSCIADLNKNGSNDPSAIPNSNHRGVFKHLNNNALSQSLHEFPSNSQVHMHYIDSKIAQFRRDSLAMRSANCESKCC